MRCHLRKLNVRAQPPTVTMPIEPEVVALMGGQWRTLPGTWVSPALRPAARSGGTDTVVLGKRQHAMCPVVEQPHNVA